MLKGFRDFLMRGNVVDLAVGVMIGGAFGSIVKALVADIITPLIGAFGGTPDFSDLTVTVNRSEFLIGDFINAVISFLIIAAVIYYVIVLPMNKLMTVVKKDEKPTLTEKKCPECLSLIPREAKRCKYCTAVMKRS